MNYIKSLFLIAVLSFMLFYSMTNDPIMSSILMIVLVIPLFIAIMVVITKSNKQKEGKYTYKEVLNK